MYHYSIKLTEKFFSLWFWLYGFSIPVTIRWYYILSVCALIWRLKCMLGNKIMGGLSMRAPWKELHSAWPLFLWNGMAIFCHFWATTKLSQPLCTVCGAVSVFEMLNEVYGTVIYFTPTYFPCATPPHSGGRIRGSSGCSVPHQVDGARSRQLQQVLH